MWTKGSIPLDWHDQQQLTEFSHSYRQIGLSLLFFRTQNFPSRRWRRGRHPSQRWTRLIDSEPNKHMLRWNIFWWCFLLLGLQNVFTPIRYYQLGRTPFEGNETQCIGWGEWSWVFSNLPFDYLDPLVWSTPLACPWDPHAESDVIKCPRSYTTKRSLGSGNPFKMSHSYIAEIQARRNINPVHGISFQGRKNNLYLSLNPIQVQYISHHLSTWWQQGTYSILIPVGINLCACVCWNLPWHSCMFDLESKTQWNVNC